MKLTTLNQNINEFVFFLKIAENILNPPTFEDRILNTSIFIVDKSVNIDAIVAFTLSHFLNLSCLKFSHIINEAADIKLKADTDVKITRLLFVKKEIYNLTSNN
jgi:hypothetical protein